MSSDVTRWNYEQTMKFISLLRAYPVLWDQDHQHFRNQFQRDLAYADLAYEMNTINKGIKRKIHTLRSQYRVEYKKLMAKQHYKPRWQYFEPLQFIYKHENIKFETPVSLDEYRSPRIFANNGISNSQSNQNNSNDVENEEKEGGTIIEIQRIPSEKASQSDEETEHSRMPPRKRCGLSSTTNDQMQSEDILIRNSKDIVSNSQIQDEFTILGESIATELRLLKDHQAIHNALRSKIERAIKEAKYAMHKAKYPSVLRKN